MTRREERELKGDEHCGVVCNLKSVGLERVLRVFHHYSKMQLNMPPKSKTLHCADRFFLKRMIFYLEINLKMGPYINLDVFSHQNTSIVCAWMHLFTYSLFTYFLKIGSNIFVSQNAPLNE